MTVAPAQSQPIQLTPFGQFVNGATSTALALAATQPLFFAKTVLQMPNPQKLAPIERFKAALIEQHAASRGQKAAPGAAFKAQYVKGLWAGTAANAGSGAAAEGLAFVVRDIGIQYLKPQNGNLSATQDFGLSAACGILGAPINASAEKVMIRQQCHGGSFVSHFKKTVAEEGTRGLFKGTHITIVRDAVYNVGLFSLNDRFRTWLAPHIQDPLQRDSAAGLAAGMAAGALSYAPDTIKTRMQEDRTGAYPTARQTFVKIVREEGLKTLVDPKGIVARALTIGPFLAATAVLKERIPAALPQSLQQK